MWPHFVFSPKTILKISLVILSCLIINSLVSWADVPSETSIEIILVSSPNCHSCHIVKQKIIPRIKAKYEGIIIKELNIDKPDDYLKALQLQDAYNLGSGEISTPTVFIADKLLTGLEQIKRYLDIYIDTEIAKGDYVSAADIETSLDLSSRFALIRPLGVVAAGLIDGINPCAFTVIIFFISFLTLQGYNKPKILAIGLSFILAVFITYVLIGLGLFNFLFQLKSYWIIVKTLYIFGALLCFILAGFAFYDFLRFRKTGQTQDFVLQLPKAFKDRIHGIIGIFYRRDKQAGNKNGNIIRLVISAFVVGIFISLFEAVCTGQVYLPTIVFVLKTTPMKLKAFSYLFLYNLMFVIPLWLILLLASWGVSSEQFSRFTQRHMGTVKFLMMVLFLGLGLFLAWQ